MSDEIIKLCFDFATSHTGWTGDFVDYPVGEEGFFELAWGWQPLPAELEGHGMRMSGNNHSDDLFMFIRNRVSGLRPTTSYQVTYRMVVATNAPSECPGAGGAPGESVFVKVGASTEEPIAIIENGYYRMNVDKGNQSEGGRNAVVVGDLANGETDCANPVYRLKEFQNKPGSLQALSSKEGVLWLFVGTDSGFEATSTPYYSRIEAELRPLDSE